MLLFYSIFLCQLAGILGSVFTISSIPTWYAGLIKPSFNPPGWLFGPVWTILYTLMGISLFLIWKKGFNKKRVKDAIVIFAIQLGLNAIWSPIFFGLKNTLLALFVIVVLLFFLLRTIFSFYKINKTASYLLIPYLLWSSFATVLNFSIWFLNR
ncbi:TspO/MBR family protein [Patescibacteria group bacterium]